LGALEACQNTPYEVNADEWPGCIVYEHVFNPNMFQAGSDRGLPCRPTCNHRYYVRRQQTAGVFEEIRGDRHDDRGTT
jgi:hypothetical protein